MTSPVALPATWAGLPARASMNAMTDTALPTPLMASGATISACGGIAPGQPSTATHATTSSVPVASAMRTCMWGPRRPRCPTNGAAATSEATDTASQVAAVPRVTPWASTSRG